MKKEQEIVIDGHSFILRDSEDSDYDFIFNLLIENMLESFQKHWGGWNDKSFKDTHRKEHIRIIEYKNLCVGYVDFKFKSYCGYVNDIQLSEKVRGKGLGTYLMKLLEQETLDHGLKRICLKVFKDNKAVQLYKRLGYKIFSEDDTSLIMEKDIIKSDKKK